LDKIPGEPCGTDDVSVPCAGDRHQQTVLRVGDRESCAFLVEDRGIELMRGRK
jgi:hypothetical protein